MVEPVLALVCARKDAIPISVLPEADDFFTYGQCNVAIGC